MNEFRLLKADEIECRIGIVKQNGFSLLLYKTARTDANLLDETVGAENWQNDFKEIGGVLYGGIGVFYEEDNRWIWKWDAGTESNIEADKGRASDAFKRAGAKLGIGRELYTSPFIWIENGNKSDSFSVAEIDYTDGRISKLVIRNDTNGKTAYEMKPSKQSAKVEKPATTQKTTEKTTFKPTCSACGKEITPSVHDYSVKNYDKPLCMDCQKKIKK